jgi:hypothetical protein
LGGHGPWRLASLDAWLLLDRARVPLVSTPLDTLDLDLLADAAVVDADERSTRPGGRFRSFDLRAGATRALSRSGVIAHRDELTATIGASIHTLISTSGVVPVCPLPRCPRHRPLRTFPGRCPRDGSPRVRREPTGRRDQLVQHPPAPFL